MSVIRKLKTSVLSTFFIIVALVITVTSVVSYLSDKVTDDTNFHEPTGILPKGAGYFYSAKRVNLSKNISSQKAIAEAVNRKREYFLNQQENDQWQAIGPFDVGGRTRAMIFKPNEPEVIFAAGVSGGVFKSENSGQSWRSVSDELENLAVVTLAIPEATPNIIFAGTGEGHYVGRPITRSRGVEGNGIFMSQDSGETWSALPYTLNNPDFRFVNRLRVSQTNTLVAATISGIWRSTDLGNSWELVLDQRSRVGGCLEIEIKPDEQNVVMASCGSFQASAVFRSTDGGDSWTEVFSEQDLGRTLIAFAPSSPSTVYMLAAQNEIGDVRHALKGLYRSEDGGENFALVTDMTSPNEMNRLLLSNALSAFNCPENVFSQDYVYGQGWFSSLLTVDPTDPERIWVGALDLMRSDDGGQTFGVASYWWADQYIGVTPTSYVHADHHLVIFHPDYDGVDETRLYNTNDGGLFVTETPNAAISQNACDPTTTDVTWQALNNNYSVNQFYHGDVSKDEYIVVGGMQDNGTYMSVDGAAWEKIGGGDGAYVAFDPTNDSEIYISSQYAGLLRVSLDDLSTIPLDQSIQEARPFITPYLVDPNKGERLFLSASSLWRSDNRGDIWTQISSSNYDNVVLDWLSSLAVQPDNSEILLVGSSDGFIFRHDAALIADASYEMSKQKVSNGYISSINYHPFDPSIVYATVSTFGEKHLLYSDDNGLDWQVIDGEGSDAFPDIPAHDVIKAPEDDTTLYIGSDLGVYVSRNNGLSWLPYGAGFPNTPVEKLLLRRNNLESTLYAFTYGRGAFKLNLSDVINVPPAFIGDAVSIDLNQNDSVAVSFAELFIDRNFDPISFSSTGLPSGLFVSATGDLSGTVSTAGAFQFDIIASDGGESSSTTVSLTVIASPELPAIEPSSNSGGGSIFYSILILLISIALRSMLKGKG